MYVDIDYVVSFAKTIVKTADNQDTNIWKDWIYTGALLHLGIGEDELEVAELKQKNFIAPLPPNCRYISELSLFDISGNQLNHKYRAGKQRIYTDQRAAANGSVPVDVSNDAYNLVFGTNGSLVDKVLIRYYKYPVDQNDQPLIRQEDVYACTLFIKLMQAMRNNENRSEIQQYDQLWKQAADKAKADKRVSSSLTADKQKTILRESMRRIPQLNMRFY